MAETTIDIIENNKEGHTPKNIQRYLTFVSDNITFGVSTDYVIEIISSYMICTLPMVPDYIKGIILEINEISVGIVVDSVTQVLDIDLDRIAPIPTQNQQELTSSMISREDGSVVLFLDCEELIRQ